MNAVLTNVRHKSCRKIEDASRYFMATKPLSASKYPKKRTAFHTGRIVANPSFVFTRQEVVVAITELIPVATGEHARGAIACLLACRGVAVAAF